MSLKDSFIGLEDLGSNEEVYIVVNSGKKFYPFNPSPEMIEIEDVAHALARTCRFNGHTDDHYSVAQHSLIMVELADRHFDGGASPDFYLKTLLHDAGEAYISDIPAPIKHSIDEVHTKMSALEDHLLRVMFEKYDLSVDPLLPPEIHDLDMELLKLEKRQVMKDKEGSWGLEDVTHHEDIEIDPSPAMQSKRRFLEKFREIQELRN